MKSNIFCLLLENGGSRLWIAVRDRFFALLHLENSTDRYRRRLLIQFENTEF